MGEFEATSKTGPDPKAGMEPAKLAAEIDKLDRPMRIAVFGVDCAATAHLVNLIVADRILPPEGGHNISIRLRFTRQHAAYVKAEGGDATRHDLEELPGLMEGHASLTIGAPLEALRKVVVLRQASEDHKSLEAAAERSVPFTDLTFLCSETFGEEERSFWENLPEQVREKGYHVLPLDAEIPGRARKLVADVIRIDAVAALEAREAPGGLDRATFGESGGMGLISAIRQELKWHERSIEEAKVALTHGVFDVRKIETGETPPATSEDDGEIPEDVILTPVSSEPTPDQDAPVARAPVAEKVNERRTENVELEDADFDRGFYWSDENEDGWHPKESSKTSRGRQPEDNREGRFE